MVTISNLLTYSAFSELKLVSDKSGLQNLVSETGIFDWETPETLRQTFLPGAFVVTTLSGMQNGSQNSLDGLRTLIDIGVAAIALKTVFIDRFPDEIVDYANRRHVPLFLFYNTFFDDIIYTVKSLLSAGNNNERLIENIRRLQNEDVSANQLQIIKDINPFFNERCLCCLCVPKARNIKGALLKYSNSYFKVDASLANRNESSNSLTIGSNCILIIYTQSEGEVCLRESLEGFLTKLNIIPDDFRLGISGEYPIEDLKSALDEGVQAAYSALAGEHDKVDFENIGMGQILIPNMHTKWVEDYYKRIYDRLTTQDKAHRSNLHETLLAYIECDGDINLTGEKLFQHGNTIRYRLGKIKSILNIDTAPDYYMQLWVYVILYKLYGYFGGENII
ncbi:MAG: PucR family transcriptional regulator [Clostridiales bacterium]|nr:PucR family transcriptional regulator [Clostridiales bacterium]